MDSSDVSPKLIDGQAAKAGDDWKIPGAQALASFELACAQLYINI